MTSNDFNARYLRATDQDKNQEKEVSELWRYGFRLGFSALFHPFDYAKTLIQLGHEPLPAKLGKSIFGKDIIVLPNIFTYTSHIRAVDGFYGCYRGLTPKLLASLLGMSFSGYMLDCMGLAATPDNMIKTKNESAEFGKALKRDIVLISSSIIISQPLHVISIRMMAQFIGRETVYDTLMGSIKEIYNTEGIGGFFSGLMPRLLCEVGCAVLTSGTVYILNKFLVKDSLECMFNAGLTQYAISSLLYPLQVVATCMAVTGARLRAGQPPITPLYVDMLHCWEDLAARGELKRGSSPIFRSQPITGSISTIRYKLSLPTISKFQ